MVIMWTPVLITCARLCVSPLGQALAGAWYLLGTTVTISAIFCKLGFFLNGVCEWALGVFRFAVGLLHWILMVQNSPFSRQGNSGSVALSGSFYLLSHSESPCRACLWPHCRNNARPLSQDAGCAVRNQDGWWASGPLEFPQSSNLELSESGTFKECCQVICITSNVRAKLSQAKGTCTGSKSDAQTAACFELGDSRFPVSGLLLSVCAVTSLLS